MVDITLLLDVNAREPLYCQLYQHIKNDIISGKLAAKTRLPSIRALSSHLHISRNTVEFAYHQLIAEGYVQSRPRSGLFVIELEHQKLPAPSPVRSKSFELSKHDRPAVQYDFRYGDVDVSHFPVSTWRKLSNQCLQPEEHTTVIGQDAGLHILLRVHNGMNESELIHAAAKVGVKVYAVSPFWICPQQADTSMVQIGFGGLSIEDIVKGVHALQRAWISKYLL